MDCVACVVPILGNSKSCELFCHACSRQGNNRSYCLAVREDDRTLRPFVSLDDLDQAAEYGARLERQGVSHLVLQWDDMAHCFKRAASGSTQFSPALGHM